MNFSLYQIILLASIFSYLFFTFFLWQHKPGKKTSNRLLAFFLFSKAGSMYQVFIFTVTAWYSEYPHLYMVTSCFSFLWGPTFYFYIRSITESDFKVQPRYFIHLMPSILSFIFLGRVFIFHSAEVKSAILMNGTLGLLMDAPILNSLQLAHLLAYVIVANISLHRYRVELKKYYSSSHRRNYSWIQFFCYGYTAKCFIDIVYVINNFMPVPQMDILMFILFSLLLGFILTIVYKALTEPYLFSEPAIIKYESSPLTEVMKSEYLDKLLGHMKEKKPYLNPELTISDLSEQISIPRRYVSQIMNENMDQNFFDFVNSYRIREAQALLASSFSSKKNILEILLESGFNSKSVFNAAFKKHTSMTPRQFKNSIQL